jgi:hypothetical protein
MNATNMGALAAQGLGVPMQELAPVNAALATDGALPIVSGSYVITKAGVLALSVAAPTAADIGTRIRITSDTANAHVITFTGGTMRGGTAAVATATLGAFAGAGISFECFVTGKWHITANMIATLA